MERVLSSVYREVEKEKKERNESAKQLHSHLHLGLYLVNSLIVSCYFKMFPQKYRKRENDFWVFLSL